MAVTAPLLCGSRLRFGVSAAMETSVKSIIDRLGYTWCVNPSRIPSCAASREHLPQHMPPPPP